MKKLLLLCCMLFGAGMADAQCIASLSAVQNPSGNNLLNVSFTNSSYYGLAFSGQRKSFNIDYGDMSSLNNYLGTSVPSHVYPSPGTYIIGFRIRSYDSATNTTICTDSTTDTITIAYPPCGSTLSVSGAGATKTFTAANPAATSGISYSWNFGDATTGTGSPAIHTYTSSGTYTVTLTATAGSGPGACSYINTTTVVIYIPPPPLNCATLRAGFNAAVSSNIATFTNTSNVVSGAYQMIANWDYGDGGTASGFNAPAHSYSAPGVYTVKLVMQWKDSLNTTSCKDSTTKTISITSVPTPANIISGNVIYDTSLGFNYFKVYLIKFDTATNILYAVDSVITGNTASPYYAFGNVPAGLYRTKAAVHNGTVTGSGFVPTYHDSSVYWSSAKVITHTGGSSINKRIYVFHGTATTGPGFIGGNVSLGANKGASSGVPNILIYLRDANMRVIQMALTDSLGNYAFSNLPLAPYSIWPERMNYSTMPVTPIVLKSSLASRNDINFNIDEGKRSIAPRNGSLSVPYGGSYLATDFLSVSPVPASGEASITWNAESNASMQFTVTNMTGQVVSRTPVLQGKAGIYPLNLQGLSHGVYFVHGTGSLSGKVARLIVQ